MGQFGVLEIVIIAVILIMLFGAKRIPGILKAIGGSIKSFKSGLNPDSDRTPDKK